MNVLKSFIDANKAEGTVSSSDTEKKENGTQDNSRKHLAMCACNDWDGKNRVELVLCFI